MVDGKENSTDIPMENSENSVKESGENNIKNLMKTPYASKIAEKYGLRPRTIVKRIQIVERTRRQQETSRESRKPKPPPLSKYRRKTANARERHRMKEINDAFATLRGILPAFSTRRPSSSGLTKITTLKLAANYIKTLSDVLQEVEPNSSVPNLNNNKEIMDDDKPSSSNTFSYLGFKESVSSNSDLGDLLSDDSCMLEENLEAFHDIPSLSEPDAFALLLSEDHELETH